ncbi:MAG: hypothetical protein KA116_00665 [Proteobacteria bacterium]|nr:hypothetical protein [Pseudomonadota bacterium]
MISEKKNALKSLIESTGGVHLSAYVENTGDLEKLRVQVADALKLASVNIQPVMSRLERKKFLKPIRSFMEDSRLLETLKGNIGIFRTQNSFRVLHIPINVKHCCIVANSFHVKPLLSWLQVDRDFILIGVEKGAVHLYQGSQYSLRHVDSMTFVNEKKNKYSKYVFWKKKKTHTFKMEDVAQWIEDWLPQVTKSSKPKLYIAGKKDLTDVLKFELSYRNISNNLSWDSFEPKYLSKICFEIREELSFIAQRTLEKSFLEFHYANKLEIAENNIFDIAKAAVQGRVRKLMIADDVNIFGKLDKKTGELELHRFDLDHEDDDLLDDLAQSVLFNGGKVVLSPKSDVPGGNSILAICEPVDPVLPRYQKSIQSTSLKPAYG